MDIFRDPSFSNLYAYDLVTDPNDPGLIIGYKRYPSGATVIMTVSLPRSDFEKVPTGSDGAPLVGLGTASAGGIASGEQAYRSNNSNDIAPGEVDGRVNPDALLGVGADTGAAAGPVEDVFDALGIDSTPITTAESANPVLSGGVENGTVLGTSDAPVGVTVIPDSDGIGTLPTDSADDDGVGFVDALTALAQSISGGSGSIGGSVSSLTNQSAVTVKSQKNILDQFYSYNYVISVYILSPDDMRRLVSTNSRAIPQNQLLLQTGGMPGATNDLEFTRNQRNQFFPLDYYLDDLEIKSVIPGKGTYGANGVVELKFKLTEQYGITLLDNLYRATRQYVAAGGTDQNYASQNFLMVIRYYGYDRNGQVLQAFNPYSTDPNAISEKFIPFQFTNIKFRIANKLVEYQCEAVCPQNVIATGTGRGVIPFNIELQGRELNDLFNGTSGVDSAPSSAPGQVSSKLNGLMDALNRYQQDLVTQGTYGIADQYELVISHPEIASSALKPPGETVRMSTAMVNAETGQEQIDTTRQSVDPLTKTVSATAGQSIIKFIDQVVRNSAYIYSQQTVIIDRDGREVPQNPGRQDMVWYRIGQQVVPIGYDPKRNDYAYRITYEIAPYAINNMVSQYFPRGVYRGSHKRYDYWFTGENTSVLRYEQDFNYLYFLTINGQGAGSSIGSTNYREYQKRLYQRNSGQSSQGIAGDQNEPSANAADFLYSPGDQAKVELTILGDPAWLQQGELWSGVRSDGATDPNAFFGGFLNDGTINFDAREALFEINFKKPVDYNIDNGLMDVDPIDEALQTYVYKAYEVINRFNKGQFTQDLKGVLLVFPDDDFVNARVGEAVTGPVPENDYESGGRDIFQGEGGLDAADPNAQTGVDISSLGVSSNAVIENTVPFNGTGVSTFTQQSPGSARAVGQRGFQQAGDEFNALDAISENQVIFGNTPQNIVDDDGG